MGKERTGGKCMEKGSEEVENAYETCASWEGE